MTWYPGLMCQQKCSDSICLLYVVAPPRRSSCREPSTQYLSTLVTSEECIDKALFGHRSRILQIIAYRMLDTSLTGYFWWVKHAHTSPTWIFREAIKKIPQSRICPASCVLHQFTSPLPPLQYICKALRELSLHENVVFSVILRHPVNHWMCN